MESKSWYLSKTVWFGIITGVAAALLPVFPQFKVMVDGALPAIGAVWGVLAIILRAVSSDKIKLLD